MITLLGLIALIPVALLVPTSCRTVRAAGCAMKLSVMRRPHVLLAIATTILSSASVFTLFTYIVPILQDVTGFTPAHVTLILFMIGIGLTFGITLGGKFSDRGPDALADRDDAGMRGAARVSAARRFT